MTPELHEAPPVLDDYQSIAPAGSLRLIRHLAREHARRNLLITRHLADYLQVLRIHTS